MWPKKKKKSITKGKWVNRNEQNPPREFRGKSEAAANGHKDMWGSRASDTLIAGSDKSRKERAKSLGCKWGATIRMCATDWKRYCLKGGGRNWVIFAFHRGFALRAAVTRPPSKTRATGAINFPAMTISPARRICFLQRRDSDVRPNRFHAALWQTRGVEGHAFHPFALSNFKHSPSFNLTSNALSVGSVLFSLFFKVRISEWQAKQFWFF